MRFRIRTGGPAGRFVFDRTPAAPPEPEAPPRKAPCAADLDNPYGRYFGKPRSWDELLGRKQHPQKGSFSGGAGKSEGFD